INARNSWHCCIREVGVQHMKCDSHASVRVLVLSQRLVLPAREYPRYPLAEIAGSFPRTIPGAGLSPGGPPAPPEARWLKNQDGRNTVRRRRQPPPTRSLVVGDQDTDQA